jgi:DNA-binding CsgD family transcriptional regulator
VGRSEELAAARRALGAGGSGVVVTGPLGVGRSRLAEEVLAEVEAAGTRVVRLAATQAAATIPYGAAAPLLASFPAGPGSGDAAGAHTVTAAADADAGADPATGAGAMAGTSTRSGDDDVLVAARRAVAELTAGGATLVVGVDDAHLLDEATATLLGELVEDGRLQVLATVRDGDPVPRATRTLWEDHGWPRVALAELGQDDVRALVVHALGGEVETLTVERLWDATRGNALFLRELCREALDSGALRREHGVWALASTPSSGPRLHDLIAARVGQLTPEERWLTGLLALGEPVRLGVVEALAVPGVLDRLRTCDLASVDRADGRPLVRLTHPLVAEAIRGRLGPLEAGDMYAALVRGTRADAEGLGGRPLDLDERLRLAVWSISSHDEVDPDLLAAAAADALRRRDPALAERLARAALGQAPSTGVARSPAPVPPPYRTSFAAALTLGEALGDLRRPDEAEAVLAPLAVLATDDPARARVATARIVAAMLSPDKVAHVRGVAASTGIADPTAADTVRAALADALGHMGELDEGGCLALALLGRSDETVRLRALPTAATLLIHLGRADDAVSAARELLPVAVTHQDDLLRARGRTASAAVLALTAAGRAHEAGAIVEAATADRAARRHDDGGTLALLRGRAALLRGRPVTAGIALGEAAIALQRADPLGRRGWALALLGEARALLGDGDGARAALDARPTRGLSRRYARDVERAELWVAAAEGDVTGATRRAIERADDARASGYAGFELLFLEVALRLGGHGVADRLVALAGVVDGVRAEVLAALAATLAGADGCGLDAVADRCVELGLDLHAAEAAAHAARVHGEAGDGVRAAAAAQRAGHLRAVCEGARPPSLAAEAGLDELTRREREVVLLAARGLSSRAIADRLELSVRTVDNQLGRAYRKLGIAGRAELPALASSPTP